MKINWQKVLKRVNNPFFLLAFASLIYQGLVALGVPIDFATFQSIVDLLTYGLIGVGIYKTYPQEDVEKEKSEGNEG